MASLKSGIIIGLAAAGVAAVALAAGGVRVSPSSVGVSRVPTTMASTATIFAPPPGAPMSFADIFERVSPAVVSIEVTSKVSLKELQNIPGFQNLPNLTPKGDDGDNNDDQAPTQKAESQGSGFFISSDGYIVTNNHVVENATDIKVTLKDGKILPAKVIGRDKATDLAVVKVDGSNYPFVDFENSAKPRVGDWVIAIGNPLGLGDTATAGIVSAYGRDIGDSFVDFIQIDAPINLGNSGGPTFDTYGRVIGVNSQIASPSGGSIGIGFAIPADVADAITKQLIAKGAITRGYMGASIENVTPEIAESLGMGDRKGALVADLTPDGPALRAGVKSGDVVVGVNGHEVDSASELTRLVAASHNGDTLHLAILRDGKPITLDVRSGTRPSEEQIAANLNGSDNTAPTAPDASPVPHPHVLGMTLGALDERTRRQFQMPADAHGALVLGVKGTSDASEQGVQAGDVIVRAGDLTVVAPQDVELAVANARKAGRTSILLGVRRDGRTAFVAVKMDG
ncbi:MAG TPA: Do family serine endopeptidase [Caulobacteraceae bacterium]|nr:Do family serine endopeptidase [Caulobacteraceae bacterium]